MILMLFLLIAHSPSQANWLDELDPSILKMTEKLNSGTAVPEMENSCNLVESSAPGCSAKVEEFCKKLYSPEKQGNMDLPTSTGSLPVRRGDTPSGLSNAFVSQRKAKLEARDRLPNEVKKYLDSNGYFQELEKLIGESKFPVKGVTAKAAQQRRIDLLAMRWTEAVDLGAAERLDRKIPGFSQKELPTYEERSELGYVKNDLYGEIYKAIWEESSAYKNLQKQFSELKKEYKEVIRSNAKISPETKRRWETAIDNTELIPPGTNTWNKDFEQCGTTEENAANSFYRGKIYVCAGHLNGSENLRTLAHELSHSIDSNTQCLIHLQEMPWIQDMKRLFQDTCRNSPIATCRPEWLKIRSELPEQVKNFSSFQVALPELLECLQYKKITSQPTEREIVAKARGSAESDAAASADSRAFLYLTKEKIPNRDGILETNSEYMNPCFTKNPTEVYFNPYYEFNFIFTMEYACTSEAMGPAQRMKNAIDSAINIQTKISEKYIPMGGKFSGLSAMVGSGYAEDPSERFADFMGQEAVARMLQKIPKKQDRLQHYLSNMSTFCNRPSFSESYPEEAQVARNYSYRVHSLDVIRRQELLTPAIRRVLGCSKDFEKKDCSL